MTRALGYMDMNLFRRIIDQQIADNPECRGKQSGLCLHHFGESLLHPAFDEALAYACGNGLDAGMSCNPFALSRDKAVRLFRAKPAWLLLALDGHDDRSFELLRGMPNAYGQTLANTLEALNCWQKYSPGTRLQLSVVDNPAYPGIVEEVAHFWKENYGIEVFRKPFSTWTGVDQDINSMRKNTPAKRRLPCATPWERLSVAFDGTIIPCCRDYNNIYSLGNASTDSLLSVWNSEKMQCIRSEVRSGMVVNTLCRNCEKKKYVVPAQPALVQK
jgi:radical SAM protein with 4Fe4S-binding SPASM domain